MYVKGNFFSPQTRIINIDIKSDVFDYVTL